MLLSRIAIISLVLTIISVAYAAESDPVAALVKNELSNRYPNTRVELTDEIHWTSSKPSGVVESVRVGTENARGQVGLTIVAQDDQGTHNGYAYTSFAAFMPARMAVRRIMPGEKLSEDAFVEREINVIDPAERDFRGVILGQKSSIANLQARQTVLEGQPLLSSAVERVPDVRRGDPLIVHIVSNGLTLSTPATAMEPGFLQNPLKILTDHTKRELSGRLVASGVVEVKL